MLFNWVWEKLPIASKLMPSTPAVRAALAAVKVLAWLLGEPSVEMLNSVRSPSPPSAFTNALVKLLIARSVRVPPPL